MNENDEEWARNTYVPDVQPLGSAGSDIGDDEDGEDREDREEDTLPPGAPPAPSPEASSGGEAPGDEDGEDPDDTLPPGALPAPSPDAGIRGNARGNEDTLIGLSEQVLGDDDRTLVGQPDVGSVSSADTLIKRAVATPADPAGHPAQETVVGPSSPTLMSTVVRKRKASGDWKWLALGAVGLVLLLGLLGGVLALIYVRFPDGVPLIAPSQTLLPTETWPPSPTSVPMATPAPPVVNTLAVPLVVPTHTGSPAPTSRPTPTLLLPTPQLGDISGPVSTLTCTDDLAYVADVTVPDDTAFSPSERFDKTWRVRNNGSCPWASTYRWKFISGEMMGASGSQEVALTAPGETADIAVALVAPGSPGQYKGVWQMVNAADEPFGQRLTVVIQVSAPGGEAGYQLKPVE